VISELDRMKMSSKCWSARHAISLLNTLATEGAGHGLYRGQREGELLHGRSRRGDNGILDCMLLFKHAGASTVDLVTDDNNLSLRARTEGFLALSSAAASAYLEKTVCDPSAPIEGPLAGPVHAASDVVPPPLQLVPQPLSQQGSGSMSSQSATPQLAKSHANPAAKADPPAAPARPPLQPSSRQAVAVQKPNSKAAKQAKPPAAQAAKPLQPSNQQAAAEQKPSSKVAKQAKPQAAPARPPLQPSKQQATAEQKPGKEAAKQAIRPTAPVSHPLQPSNKQASAEQKPKKQLSEQARASKRARMARYRKRKAAKRGAQQMKGGSKQVVRAAATAVKGQGLVVPGSEASCYQAYHAHKEILWH